MENNPCNILFIAVDDLRPELGCYGVGYIHSPNMDRLAQEGYRFDNAYCCMSWCAPSRTSLMTGLRPGTTGVRDLQTHFREKLPDAVTLPQFFKQKGYTSLGFGKLYHNDEAMQDPLSWSRKCWMPPGEQPILAYAGADNLSLAQASPYRKASATESADVPDTAYPDGMITSMALRALDSLSQKGQPFFMGVGYYKPHLPFTAPERYWKLYDRDQIPLSRISDTPEGGSAYMFRTWSEPGSYQDISMQEPYPDSLARRLKHGYAACVSFIDAQIGKLLDELDRLELREHTIVVIWGDHGWKLGEYGRWSKHSNMEIDTRVPLIINIPGQEAKTVSHIAETIDLYPTLARLAGQKIPSGLEGEDLFNKNRNYALSQITRDSIIGYSVRTPEFRYIEWRSGRDPEQVLEAELYDHRSSHQELVNCIADPLHKETIDELRSNLEKNLTP